MRILLSLLAAFFVSTVSAQTTTLTQLSEGSVRSEVLAPDLTMHTFLSKGLPGGLGSVNSHVFESKNSVLIIDAQFYKAAALELKDFVLSLNKPVEKIIVSHAHPDHGFGAAYLADIAPVVSTESTAKEAEQSFPFFAQMMAVRMGKEAAAENFPVENLPIPNGELALGSFKFGATNFEVFEVPSHEVGMQTFIALPEHGLLLVFDAIMPNAHQLVFATGDNRSTAFKEKITTGFALIDTLESRKNVDRLVFGHNSIEPLLAEEQLANAREGLSVYSGLADSANAAEFIEGAKKLKPNWGQFYVPMTAGSLFPEK